MLVEERTEKAPDVTPITSGASCTDTNKSKFIISVQRRKVNQNSGRTAFWLDKKD